jgi:hypothetical protein
MRLTLLLLVLCGCGSSSVGEPCGGESSTDTRLVDPAVECASRLCLIAPAGGACTVGCASDDDCAGASARCPGGFTCAVPFVAGRFACQPLCTCRGDLVPGLNLGSDGRAALPCACGGSC